MRLGELRDINIESLRLGVDTGCVRQVSVGSLRPGGDPAGRTAGVARRTWALFAKPAALSSESRARNLFPPRCAGGLGQGVPNKAHIHLATPAADPAMPRLPRGNTRGPYFIYPKRTPPVVIFRNPRERNIRQREARVLRIRLAPYSPRPRPFPQVRRLVLTTPRKPARNTQYLPQGEGFRY